MGPHTLNYNTLNSDHVLPRTARTQQGMSMGHVTALSPNGLTIIFHGLIAVKDAVPIRVLVDTGAKACT